jgi:hypothetical protein
MFPVHQSAYVEPEFTLLELRLMEALINTAAYYRFLTDSERELLNKIRTIHNRRRDNELARS